MALLKKKIKAATLVETLVASVLIVVVFTMATLVLNQVVQSNAKANTQQITHELNRLQYLYSHAKLPTNYRATFGNWELTLVPVKNKIETAFVLQASHRTTGKKLERSLAPL